MNCEKCGIQCLRDSYHNGICEIYGPWGCPSCKWSEWEEYDCSDGAKRDKESGCIVNQYGMLFPGTSDGSGTGRPDNYDDDWDEPGDGWDP